MSISRTKGLNNGTTIKLACTAYLFTLCPKRWLKAKICYNGCWFMYSENPPTSHLFLLENKSSIMWVLNYVQSLEKDPLPTLWLHCSLHNSINFLILPRIQHRIQKKFGSAVQAVFLHFLYWHKLKSFWTVFQFWNMKKIAGEISGL